MLKNKIIPILITVALLSTGIAQDISIFFLKDGSIVQGSVLNENQSRIFLKTDQGTIKILTSDVLGREDLARKGDLSFLSDRVDYLQNQVNHLTGKLNVLNDSLDTVLDQLEESYVVMDGLQGEFEVDLLRIHAQTRERKKQVQYLQDDMVDKRVDIAANRQELTGLKDTVGFYVDQFKKGQQKLETTSNTAFLLTGTVSNTRRELQDAVSNQKNQQNQIDIISSAIADLIQKVDEVKESFSAIEASIKMNENSISALEIDIKEKNQNLNERLDLSIVEYTERLKLIDNSLEDMSDEESRYRKKIELDLKDLNDLSNRKIDNISKRIDEMEKDFFTVQSNIDGSLSTIKSSIDRLSDDIKNIKKTISESDKKK